MLSWSRDREDQKDSHLEWLTNRTTESHRNLILLKIANLQRRWSRKNTMTTHLTKSMSSIKEPWHSTYPMLLTSNKTKRLWSIPLFCRGSKIATNKMVRRLILINFIGQLHNRNIRHLMQLQGCPCELSYPLSLREVLNNLIWPPAWVPMLTWLTQIVKCNSSEQAYPKVSLARLPRFCIQVQIEVHLPQLFPTKPRVMPSILN